MKVTLESTTRIVEVNGVKARVWEGKTENGVECFALITSIAVHKDDDAAEFERDLQEHKPPSVRAVQIFPLRMFLD